MGGILSGLSLSAVIYRIQKPCLYLKNCLWRHPLWCTILPSLAIDLHLDYWTHDVCNGKLLETEINGIENRFQKTSNTIIMRLVPLKTKCVSVWPSYRNISKTRFCSKFLTSAGEQLAENKRNICIWEEEGKVRFGYYWSIQLRAVKSTKLNKRFLRRLRLLFILIKVNIVIISLEYQFSRMTKTIADIVVFYFALQYYDSIPVMSW